MAQYDVQYVIKHVSNLPEDACVNTLHFEVNAPDTLEGLADGINAAYVGINSLFSYEVNGSQVRIYTSGMNPQGPVFQKDYTDLTGGSGNAPPEIAICLSYATEDDPDASVPRRRGRIYLGPLSTTVTSASKVSALNMDTVLDLGEALAQVGTAGNTTWLHYSKTDNQYNKIESIWVDDAWDVQRRRGFPPACARSLSNAATSAGSTGPWNSLEWK